MILERLEKWGIVQYDTSKHRFFYKYDGTPGTVPYSLKPLLLNIDLTMKCNMNCLHCVVRDFEKPVDLVITPELITWINESPFMAIVITGGEPFLPEYESELITLLTQIKGKGLIIDTNGTILPSEKILKTIKETNAMVRVSWDSLRPQDEIYFRQVRRNTTQKNKDENIAHYTWREENVHQYRSLGIDVSIQSVIHKRNIGSIHNMPATLGELSIKQWYIQRFIPSHKAKSKKYEVDIKEHFKVVTQLVAKSEPYGIECIVKKDKRHNSVFLLIGGGEIYTQGNKPGQKIIIGNINSTDWGFFDYVSPPDHAERYFG